VTKYHRSSPRVSAPFSRSRPHPATESGDGGDSLRGFRHTRIERAFGVEIADFRSGDRRWFVNVADPSLPADIAASVQTLIGLNDLGAHRVRCGPAVEEKLKDAKDCVDAPSPQATWRLIRRVR
jgi:hypothetical protein